MGRIVLVQCDVCGCKVELYDWIYLPYKRMLVFPLLFNRTGGAFFDTCGKQCEIVFREYCKFYFGEDVHEPDTNKRHTLLHLDGGRAADGQAITISQGIKGFKT